MESQSAAGNGIAPPGWFDTGLHWISLVIEATGVAVIVLGAVAAIALFLLRLARGGAWSGTYHAFRTSLARAILLGLEFLVAADIIGTVAVGGDAGKSLCAGPDRADPHLPQLLPRGRDQRPLALASWARCSGAVAQSIAPASSHR